MLMEHALIQLLIVMALVGAACLLAATLDREDD